MSNEVSTVVSLYIVKKPSGEFLGGFDADIGKPVLVTNPLLAKKFSNKYDIKLRPDELVVELTVDLAHSDVNISDPFRPHRRVKSPRQ